jgi:glycosyltransferase involved in cell wall biosynthesis
MSCGLPGLVSTQDGAVDHIQEGQNGFYLPQVQSAEALHSKIKEALALDDEQRAQMGEKARQTMLSLTWERHLNEWESLFQR